MEILDCVYVFLGKMNESTYLSSVRFYSWDCSCGCEPKWINLLASVPHKVYVSPALQSYGEVCVVSGPWCSARICCSHMPYVAIPELIVTPTVTNGDVFSIDVDSFFFKAKTHVF